MMTTTADEFQRALAFCTAILAIKMMVNHLLVVRCRMAGKLEGKFGELQTTPEAHPTKWYGGFMFPIFYYALFGWIGPYRGANDMERFLCMERNASENEPHFILVSIMWWWAASSSSSRSNNGAGWPSWAPTAVYFFLYMRLLHVAFYCFVRIQPWRAVFWSMGVIATLVVSVQVLLTLAANQGGSSAEL